MKHLILAIFVSLTAIQASAVGVACRYSDQPCDAKGNHYECVTYGWVGEREFCSETDRTYPRPHSVQDLLTQQATAQGWYEECVKECRAATGQRDCGGRYCW